ncbi:846_t:CDS:1 [Cetraspora pellucida]|uniref:846_t:CDS:1 n=1 Tax=Cetraspora pellucida TaxID=1433469 RepID=A0ACA9K0K9_9GLOM|nr:846_t:CDS:1 [Cetraspora pellucida]
MNQLILMNLPTDCLVEILGHLKYDTSSLYSCILVNRLWCKLSIPLLWCSPFEFTRYNNKSDLIIETYVSCFSDDEKKQFYDNIFLIPDFQKPAFNYPIYLHNLDIPTFENAVRNWFYEIWNNYAPKSSDFSLSSFSTCKRIIAQMLFNRSIGFRALKMNRDEQDHSFYFDMIVNSGIQYRLSKLSRLDLCYNVTRNIDAKFIVEGIINLFNTLSRYVHHLEHISFIFGTENPNLQFNVATAFVNLIKSQENLLSLELYKFWDHSTADDIYSALNSQSKSLTYLKILGAKDFIQMLPFLENCSNLKTLYITPSIIYNHSDSISFKEIPLKNLYFHHYTEPKMITSTIFPILRMSSRSLRTLTLQRVNLEHLSIIERYCQFIKNLTLSISCSQLPRFCRIISKMELESLTLKKVLDDYTFDINSIHDLAISIPKSLINFGIGFKMSPQTLDLFLRECPATLVILDLYYYFNMIDDPYLEVFIQHSKENISFKRLNFEEAPSTRLKSVLDRPSKLLEYAMKVISIKKFKFGSTPLDGPFGW